jgi:hypothetical protein
MGVLLNSGYSGTIELRDLNKLLLFNNTAFSTILSNSGKILVHNGANL